MVEASPQEVRFDSAELVRMCAGDDPLSGIGARRLVNEVLSRGNWALHRHVHLVRAFETALVGGGITTALSVGCGAGLSELFLAIRHPEIAFHLTDFDESRLDIGRRRVQDLEIGNVTFGSLDLLGEPDGRRYDWVSSIEVLEHIEDDHPAARHLQELSSAWWWILVPHCTPADLTNPGRIRRAWEKCGHYRPGYTSETLRHVLGDDAEIDWLRTCYHEPAATSLRNRIKEAEREVLIADRVTFVAEACLDLDGPVDAPGGGIEVLGRAGAAGSRG